MLELTTFHMCRHERATLVLVLRYCCSGGMPLDHANCKLVGLKFDSHTYRNFSVYSLASYEDVRPQLLKHWVFVCQAFTFVSESLSNRPLLIHCMSALAWQSGKQSSILVPLSLWCVHVISSGLSCTSSSCTLRSIHMIALSSTNHTLQKPWYNLLVYCVKYICRTTSSHHMLFCLDINFISFVSYTSDTCMCSLWCQ